MRKMYLVPNIITAFSLAAGLLIIFKLNMAVPGSDLYSGLKTASILLLFAAFADWVDGALARVMRAESEFGFLFDSLADGVTFGVAPAVFMLESLAIQKGTHFGVFAVLGAMLFSICGILRLVRFNVKAAAAKDDPKQKKEQQKHFTGLPIPAAALAAVGCNLLFVYPPFEELLGWNETTHLIVSTVIMIVLGYFMVSRFKFPSAKMLHFRVPSFQLVFVAVLAALFFLYGILYFFPLALAGLSWVYILIGWTFAIIRAIAGKKSKTLADFEPDDDND